MKQIVTISPSGNFYGSEQVLFDYLSETKLQHTVKVKGHGELFIRLKTIHIYASQFQSEKKMYIALLALCMAGKVKSVYANEAGHSRYLKAFAFLFPFIRFVVHVRIIEDTKKKRWGGKCPQNLKVVSISRFIQNKLSIPSRLIYDPYPFSENALIVERDRAKSLHVGIIGRISESKGVDNILELLGLVEKNGCADLFCFHFFGEPTIEVLLSGKVEKIKKFSNVVLEGFVADKGSMYNRINCVLHGAENEPLGRIFLEAIDRGLPFIGINSGGIGEIASLVGLEQMLVTNHAETIGTQLLFKLQTLKKEYGLALENLALAKERAKNIFSLSAYTEQLDSLLSAKEAHA